MRRCLTVIVGGSLMAALGAACVSDRYIIGRFGAGQDGGTGGGGTGTGGGAGAGGQACSAGGTCRFSADLDHNGISLLPDVLTLPSTFAVADLRYRGERAASDGWHADHGPLLPSTAASARTEQPTPFTDATLAVGLAPGAPSYVAAAAAADLGTVGADDVALEVVLRAALSAPVVSKGTADAGWTLSTNAGGALVLALGDGTGTAAVASEALTPGAWYHCLAWISHAKGGRIDCDGRLGVLADLGALGSIPSTGSLTVGGVTAGGIATGSSGATLLALFQLFRFPAGSFGPSAGWQTISRTRFAQLTGVFPRLATGTALPREGLRPSVAYVDIQRAARGPRMLFLLGADWPRIACRTDVLGIYGCGYLSEPQSNQTVDPAPSAWTTTELTVTSGNITFVDDLRNMEALVPSSNAVAHVVSRRGTFSGPRQSWTFFAHAGAGHLLGVSVAAHGTVIFDVEAGTLATPPAGVTASIEDWGHGIYRCVYTFDVEGGALDYRVTLLDQAGAATFAGDGVTPWVHLAGLQLDANQPYAGSLLPAGPQAAEHLTYAAGDGNVPAGAVGIALRVILPPGPRLVDQSVLNINLAGDQNNSIELFVNGQIANFEFRGRAASQTSWAFMHPTTALDGVGHSLVADWGGATVDLTVDGVLASRRASTATAPPPVLDRIDVGSYARGGGNLQGLVAGLQIRSP